MACPPNRRWKAWLPRVLLAAGLALASVPLVQAVMRLDKPSAEELSRLICTTAPPQAVR